MRTDAMQQHVGGRAASRGADATTTKAVIEDGESGPHDTRATHVKEEVIEDIILEDDDLLLDAPLSSLGHEYTVHRNSGDIDFEPMDALSQGLLMADAIERCIGDLNLEVKNSNMRKNDWASSLRNLRRAARSVTTIAICGGTGTGKSSLINAILDMHIVPTDGVQACTSVITEIQWHETANVIVEIVFLTKEDWVAELTPLLQDLAEEDDLGKDIAAAFDKLKFVYPQLRPEHLRGLTAEQLVRSHEDTFALLGTTETVIVEDTMRVADEIRQYVGTGKRGYGTEVELWPLLSTVKIKCNSPALSSGAVLVDLPGTVDANRARGAIASTYMARADFVWIVAPIMRAISDRTAQDLMGDAFRTQLLMDGGYNDRRVTFIATNTDNLKCAEIITTLELSDDPVLEEIVRKIEEYDGDIKALSNEFKRVHSKCPSHQQYSALRGDITTGMKRKSVCDYSESMKKARVTGSEQKIQHTQLHNPCTSIQRQKAEEILNSLSVKLAHLKDEKSAMQQEKKAFCARKRSEYACTTIKSDFREGLKSIHSANAEARNPQQFDPQAPSKTFDNIDLPVFTCSSRDYRLLQGQVADDGDATCFIDIDSTGIPQIQNWCYHLANARLEKSAHSLLLRLTGLAAEISLYARGIPLDEVVKADQNVMRRLWDSSQAHVAGGIASRLKAELAAVVETCREQLREQVVASLADKCQEAALKAALSAEKTSDDFAADMPWQTYIATLRRHGEWRSNDLNAELSLPFTRKIALFWAKTFQGGASMSFESGATQIISTILDEVKNSATPLLQERAEAQAEQSLTAASAAINDAMELVHDVFDSQQKSASRCLAPHLKTLLKDGYDEAIRTTGRGSVQRRKDIIHDHVASIKDTAFDDAARFLLDQLHELTDAVGDELGQALDQLSEKMEVIMGVLWESPDGENLLELKACVKVQSTMAEIQDQVKLWQLAAPPLVASTCK